HTRSDRDWSSDVCSSDLLGRVATALDEGGVILVGQHAAGATQVVDRGAVELAADLFADHRATDQDRHVLQHSLAPVAKAGRLDRSEERRVGKEWRSRV